MKGCDLYETNYPMRFAYMQPACNGGMPSAGAGLYTNCHRRTRPRTAYDGSHRTDPGNRAQKGSRTGTDHRGTYAATGNETRTHRTGSLCAAKRTVLCYITPCYRATGYRTSGDSASCDRTSRNSAPGNNRSSNRAPCSRRKFPAGLPGSHGYWKQPRCLFLRLDC